MRINAAEEETRLLKVKVESQELISNTLALEIKAIQDFITPIKDDTVCAAIAKLFLDGLEMLMGTGSATPFFSDTTIAIQGNLIHFQFKRVLTKVKDMAKGQFTINQKALEEALKSEFYFVNSGRQVSLGTGESAKIFKDVMTLDHTKGPVSLKNIAKRLKAFPNYAI